MTVEVTDLFALNITTACVPWQATVTCIRKRMVDTISGRRAVHSLVETPEETIRVYNSTHSHGSKENTHTHTQKGGGGRGGVRENNY